MSKFSHIHIRGGQSKEEKTRNVWGEENKTSKKEKNIIPPRQEREDGRRTGRWERTPEYVPHNQSNQKMHLPIEAQIENTSKRDKEGEKDKATGTYYAISSHRSHRCSLLLFINDVSPFPPTRLHAESHHLFTTWPYYMLLMNSLITGLYISVMCEVPFLCARTQSPVAADIYSCSTNAYDGWIAHTYTHRSGPCAL